MFKSIILKHCWVCGGRDGLNDHHCVPQAYGGVDGPQVTLCANHHTVIHTVALSAPANWDNKLTEKESVQRAKLKQLIEIIHRARAACRNIEKPMQLNHKLNVARARQLRELKTLLGVSSVNAALEQCIDIVYKQRTPLKK